MTNNIPIYSIVAHSGTGKTTVMLKLLEELRRRGFRVAVLKNDAHGFEIDHEGKDTWRYTQAGAEIIAITSEAKTAIIEHRYVAAERIVEQITDVDIILAEGYKRHPWPKIAVYRSSSGKEMAVAPEQCIAVMTDVPLNTTTPCLDLDDAQGLTDIIVAHLEQASAGQ